MAPLGNGALELRGYLGRHRAESKEVVGAQRLIERDPLYPDRSPRAIRGALVVGALLGNA
jgi:hypothetical protein